MLKKIVKTYAMFLLALFGEDNQHYQCVCLICRTMHYHKNNMNPFTEKCYREITWAIVVNRHTILISMSCLIITRVEMSAKWTFQRP